ncbi:PREDICTED: nuclear pore complex protein NUP107 [Tarenaya hassleriana]|uniref:nuclear pore complex protein NUP107 n=1 Tax=Tarenaya hassleriana TaxID=28532 RepID=UPI00053C8B52|nr:PREDICTED: nuclear pore complex protein NUP107 [Tarenaya hassleriana]
MDMDTSPGYFDPEDLSVREQFRRYRKRHSTSPQQEGMNPNVSESRLLYDGHNIHSPTNTALLLENIKEEADSFDTDHYEGTHAKLFSTSRINSVAESSGIMDADDEALFRRVESHSLNTCKIENDELAESGDTTFALFASLFDSALQGLIPIPDLILRLEKSCRHVSQSIRYGSNIRHRVVEDKLMRQKAQFLLDEAASWSLLWSLYGKATEEVPATFIMSPTTSHLEACQFVVNDHTAQLCLRIVQWLEELASKALDLERKVRGSHVGTYLPHSGVWHHTQKFLKKTGSAADTVRHLDFDAPTREHARLLSDDNKQDESLLEDVWTLIRAGRIEEACGLCRSAGQSWRAATLSPFAGLDMFPSVEALVKNGKNRTLQAIELESGFGNQFRLWKWASYCASEKIAEQDGGKHEVAVYASHCSNLKRMLPICTDWESACWAMAKSWLDVQVDMEIAQSRPELTERLKSCIDATDGSPEAMQNGYQASYGPDDWPLHVLNQQPRDLPALLQKLHSGEMVHDAVVRGCKEQHRQIQMNLMVGNISHLLDMIWSWIAPLEDDQSNFRPHGDPHMIRFGAHLVLVLRHLLSDEIKDSFREKLMNVGDLILHMYAMFLFSKHNEELVGIYASQLAHHRCIELFVHMMELRMNSSVHVKCKIFLSAMEFLPFSPVDDSQGNFEEIIDRVLSRSREVKLPKYDQSLDVAEQHRQQSLQKAIAIQWLCFTPPSTIKDVKDVSSKLLLRALMHSNILFREFALIAMWRVPSIPVGAHTLLSFLAEPLKQLSENPETLEDYVTENLLEFQGWNEYYSCDAKYRNWLKIQLENAEAAELSEEEKQKAVIAAKETLDSSLSLLLRKENPWLTFLEDHVFESEEPLFLELHATAMLCLPSGECLHPDATVCAALMSALYSSVSEEVVLDRQLMINVAISSRDNYCIEVVLRCLAVEGDGLGPHDINNGGILSAIAAAGFKGELPRFQSGVTMDISRLDAWYSTKDGSLETPATYIVRGLCRRCCLPELILRSMQVSVSLVETGNPPEDHDKLIELVASEETGFLHLFSQQQLQEFMLFEREYCISQVELQEELSS